MHPLLHLALSREADPGEGTGDLETLGHYSVSWAELIRASLTVLRGQHAPSPGGNPSALFFHVEVRCPALARGPLAALSSGPFCSVHYLSP